MRAFTVLFLLAAAAACAEAAVDAHDLRPIEDKNRREPPQPRRRLAKGGLRFKQVAKLQMAGVTRYRSVVSIALGEKYAAVSVGGYIYGKVHVFERNGANSWTPSSEIGGEGTDYHFFGTSLAIKDNFLFIGSTSDDDNGNQAGAVLVYRNNNNGWEEQGKLYSSKRGNKQRFGQSMAVDGNFLVVGAPYDKNTATGDAYVFRFNGSAWAYHSVITAPDLKNADRYGTSVAIDGNTILVGSPKEDNGRATPGPYTFIVFWAESGS